MCVGIRLLAVGRCDIGVGLVGGDDLTCSNYRMWHNKVFPYS